MRQSSETVCDKLNPKQRKFVEEYIKSLNATQAAERAGYAKKTCHVQGPRLLGNVSVATEIDNRMRKRAKKAEISAEEVLHDLITLARSNIKNYLNYGPGGVVLTSLDELTDEQAACISEVQQTENQQGKHVKFKLYNKLDALDKIARHLGMFIDRLNLDVTSGGSPINVRDLDSEALRQRVTQITDMIRPFDSGALPALPAGDDVIEGECEDVSDGPAPGGKENDEHGSD